MSGLGDDSLVATLRLLICDDHPLLRQGLRKVLEARPDWEVVAEAADGREAVRQAIALRPDVAIIDVGMPVLNGIDATRQIVQQVPDTPVLVLSMYADEEYVTRAMESGATGYMLKDSAGDELLKGVESVANRQPFVSRAVGDPVTRSDDLLGRRRRHLGQGDDQPRPTSRTAQNIE